MVLGIGTDLVTGRVSETTLYKGLSFAWSLVALAALKAVYEMWSALGQVTKDIRALKEKGHLQGIDKPTVFGEGVPIGSFSLGPMGEKEVVEKMNLLQKILQKKEKNEPVN